MGDSLWVFDPSGKLLYANESAVRFLGFSDLEACLQVDRDPVAAKSFRDAMQIWDETGKTVHRSNLPHIHILSGKLKTSSSRILRMRVRPDFPDRWVIASQKPRFDAAGKLEMLISMTHDITDVRSKNQALRQSERELSLIYENVTDLIGLMQVNGPGDYNILTANRAYFLLSPKTREQVIGKKLEEFLTPEGYALWDGKAREILKHKKPIHFESQTFSIKTPITLEHHWSPILSEDGSVSHILFTAKNVTELKTARDKLRQSEKMEAMGQLAGGVAHDFNNLLTAINGFAYLSLARGDLPGDIKEYLEGIRKAGEKAASLTSQLLAYSRKTVMMPRLLNLNVSVAEMDKILRRLIHEDITVTSNLKPDLGLVKVDPGQMSQVVLNLAVNARDAMPRGGQLSLETDNVFLPGGMPGAPAEALPGPYVVFTVRDTGVGMTAEVREKIFEPFFTTKEPGQGTGLGLSSVYGIVQQSGGCMAVESEPGKGSTFRVFLPMAEASEEPGIGPAPEHAPRGRETLLLVEDEEPVRIFIRKALESLGYTVRDCRDGNEAMRILEDQAKQRKPATIHLLLTDLIMPGVAGSSLFQRAREFRPDLKALFISGYADHALVKETLSLPGVQFLQKPFSPVQLALKVRQALDQPTQNSGSKKPPRGL